MSRVSSVVAHKSKWLTVTTQFMQLIRFSHTIFALPFALLATVPAGLTLFPVACQPAPCVLFCSEATLFYDRKHLYAWNVKTTHDL